VFVVRYHNSAFVMLLRLIASILVAVAAVLLLEWAGLGHFGIRVVVYLAAGLWAGAEMISRNRREIDEQIGRDEMAKSTGVDPGMARYEARAAKELRQPEDGTRKPK
jgi:hypothetical protein